MVMNLKNIIKEEMDDLGWVKNTYPTLGDAWDDGLINRGDILTLSGTLVDTNGRNPIEVDDLKIKIDKKSEKINASYFYLLNDKYTKHLGVESDYRDREEKIRFYTTDGKLRILELIKANNINESDELDWVKDIEPRPPLKIGTCLTFKQYEEEEDWVEDEYGNMVDHGKMDWYIIGKFIDEYNDNKPTFKMVATDRMGEGREIWMEVEKVKELYDEGVYKPCKKQTYLKRIMKEEINDFNWLDSQSDDLEWIKDTSPNNIHISDLKKGMVVTLHHPEFSSLKNRKLTVDETWHDKEMGHCVHFKEMDKIQYPFGEDREPTIPGIYVCEHLGVQFKLIDYPINESDDLDWIKNLVNTKLAKDENWILVNDIDRKSITEGHEIQKYLFDLGYGWGIVDSKNSLKNFCVYTIYHFGNVKKGDQIYYGDGCRSAEVRVSNKDIKSGKYMLYYWSDLKPKTINESDELDWIRNTTLNKWDYFEELIKDEPDVNIEKNEDGEWVDLKDAQGRLYFGDDFSTEYELEEDIKSNSLPDFLNATSQHIEVSFQGYDYEQDEDYWDFLTLKEVLEKANEITQ